MLALTCSDLEAIDVIFSQKSMARTHCKSHLTTKGLEVFPEGRDLEILGEQYLRCPQKPGDHPLNSIG